MKKCHCYGGKEYCDFCKPDLSIVHGSCDFSGWHYTKPRFRLFSHIAFLDIYPENTELSNEIYVSPLGELVDY